MMTRPVEIAVGSDEMDSGQDGINQFFTEHLESEHKTFRLLSNGLKALVIHEGCALWKSRNKGRPVVLDIGCGRGGDILKIARLNPRSYIGLDINASEISEARDRVSELTTSGRLSLARCDFHEFDMRKDKIPLGDETVDIVLAQLSLHFAFQDQSAVDNILGEMRRVMKSTSVVIGVIPDAKRISRILSEQTSSSLGSMGHFVLSCVDESRVKISEQQPVGIAYTFSLHAGSCIEYLAPMEILTEKLDDMEISHWSAQNYISKNPESIDLVKRILQDSQVSSIDWASLAIFRVFQIRYR
jgi:ubiquinone/menaquinone biosynthesis C-methylase UbiE